jgi:hypothetical protein
MVQNFKGGIEMKCTIKINMDNAAFEDKNSELARILAYLSSRLAAQYTLHVGHHQPLLDYNGNVVGILEIKGGK